jgi:hypothetical protein
VYDQQRRATTKKVDKASVRLKDSMLAFRASFFCRQTPIACVSSSSKSAMMHLVGYILLIVHFFLFFWALGGVFEMVLPKVLWKPYTNPDFPAWVLVKHWSSVLFASITFLYGYLTHWSKTPQIMVVAYALMALVCVIETFWYITSNTKYLAMIAEFVTYIAILLLLFRNSYFVEYFNK